MHQETVTQEFPLDKIKVQLAKMGPRNEVAHVYVEKWLLDESAFW
jgi:hypothetical protein